jgi:hypothetical protein
VPGVTVIVSVHVAFGELMTWIVTVQVRVIVIVSVGAL